MGVCGSRGTVPAEDRWNADLIISGLVDREHGLEIVAAAASIPPAAPAPCLCWFWSDATQTQGYWDHC